MTAAAPSPGAAPPPGGFAIHALDSVGSTNDEARRLAEAGAPGRTVVWAREQTAGRGRYGRAWASPRGNLYCSVLLRPACGLREAAQLALVAGCALADALGRLAPSRAAALGLKWPNDVLLGGAKVAGILLEAGGERDGRCGWLIIGTGVNVAGHPADAAYPATHLGREGFTALADAADPVERVLAAYLDALDRWLGRWGAEGFVPVRAAWLARAHGLGGRITLRLAGGLELRGRFAGLAAGGALVLSEDGAGRVREVTAGDVFFAEGPAA